MQEQRSIIHRYCSMLFALLLAFGPIVGNVAYAGQFDAHDVAVQQVVGATHDSSLCNLPEDGQQGGSTDHTVVLKAHAFHAIITGSLEFHAAPPVAMMPLVLPSTQESVFLPAVVYSPALLVYYQNLCHHFIAPQAP